jgi:hypothetical protein
MFDQALITFPRGLFDHDGGRHQHALLSPITGHLEAHLARSDRMDPDAVSALLSRAIVRIGNYTEVEPSHAAALSRSDRAIALLHLQRGLFGDRLALIVRCENPSCGQEADLTLQLSELLRPHADVAETLVVETEAGRVVLRQPTGADDAAVQHLPKDAASAELWTRLILDFAGRGRLNREEWSSLAASVRSTIAVALAETTSEPTLAFMVPCPSCRGWLELELDPAELLARRLGVAADRLFAEVHTLALAYHWSEHDILSLPRDRRWRYLELIARQLSGRVS